MVTLHSPLSTLHFPFSTFHFPLSTHNSQLTTHNSGYLWNRMQGLRIFSLNPLKNSRWSFSVLFLLAIYLSVFVKSSAVLPHTHTHHEEHTTETEEKNPCHIALFHPGKEGGCGHKTHVSEGQKECSIPHLTFVRQTTPPETEIPVFIPAFSFTEYYYQESSFSQSILSASNRGPPAV